MRIVLPLPVWAGREGWDDILMEMEMGMLSFGSKFEVENN